MLSKLFFNKKFDRQKIPPLPTTGTLITGGINSGLNNLVLYYLIHYMERKTNIKFIYHVINPELMSNIIKLINKYNYTLELEQSELPILQLQKINKESSLIDATYNGAFIGYNIASYTDIIHYAEENHIWFESDMIDTNGFINKIFMRHEMDGVRGLQPGEAIYKGRKYYYPLIIP